MDVEERFHIAADPDRVWDLLSDVKVVASCLPGAELDGGEGGTYEGHMRVAFGPTTAVFSGQAEIALDHRERRAEITARGRDSRGATRAAASVIVVASAEPGGCGVTVTANLDISGPLAQFARTGGVHVTRELLRDFAECLAERATDVAARSGLGPTAVTVPSSTPEPSRVQVVGQAPAGGFRLLWRVLRSWLRDRVKRKDGTATRSSE